jgi:biotin synthase-like enzyme
MLLRALRKLNIGIEKYEVFNASRISKETREILLKRGIVSVVNAPPVATFGVTDETLEKLEAAGVETLADVIETESVEGITDEELKALKGIANDALTVKKPDCGCGG